MRAAAEIDEIVARVIQGDLLVGKPLDQLKLVGLVGKDGAGLIARDLAADKVLAAL